MAQTNRQALGKWGEDQAADYLVEQGYTILERNVRTPYGEIDLLAALGNCQVFVEVKTRSSTRYGQPEEAITPKKRAHLLACAQAYIQNHPGQAGEWRIDVIAILLRRGGLPPEIVHFENVAV